MVSSNLRKRQRFWRDFRQEATGWLYMIPVIVGILAFTISPMVISLIYSFHDYDPTRANPAEQLTNFGLQNYIRLFDPKEDLYSILRSYYLTFRYAIVTIIVGNVGSYALALFLNQKFRGVKVFRVLYYLPCLIPTVVSSLLWLNITGVDAGYVNLILTAMGLPRYTFYEAKETVFPTIILLSTFGFGGSMIPWLASMKNVPNELYEAADIDGANSWTKFWKITLPLTTPMIFYNLILSLISSLQVFGNFYTIRNGINDSEIDFVVLKIYGAAFDSPNTFGYACAQSWLLFAVIALLSALVFKTSKWVYYGEDN